MEKRQPRFNREEWQLEYLAGRVGQNSPAHVPLTTNWPDLGNPAKKDRPAPVYFIDLDGITVGQAKTKAGAREIVKKCFPGAVVRMYQPTSESMEEENRQQRELFRLGVTVRQRVV